MDINGLPPVSNSASLVTPILKWAGRLVAPLGTSMMSKEGITAIAGRINGILGLAILAVIAIAIRYRSSILQSLRPNEAQSANSTALGGSSTQTVQSSEKGAGEWDQETTQPPIPAAVAQSSSAVTAASSATNESREVERASDNPAQQTGEALKLIERQFKALFLGLRQIDIPHRLVAGIEMSLQEFHQNFDKHKDLSDCSTHFDGIKYIETSLTYLKAMREHLFLAPIRMDDKGIISQPSDGNCLYHSLVEGLVLLKENLIQRAAWIDEPLDHESLRAKVVRWMIANSSTDVLLRDYLDRAVGDYIEVRKGQYMGERDGLEALRLLGEDIAIASASLSDAERQLSILEALDQNQKHKWYLDQAGQPQFFASVAEMYAFSKLYPQVSVHVWRELGGEWNNNFDAPFNNSDLTINLAYNLSGDHFNIYVPKA